MNRTPLILGLPLLGAMVFASGCFAPPTEAGKDSAAQRTSEPMPCLTPDEAQRTSDQVLQLINLERSEAGMPPVVWSSALAKIAEQYACVMIEDGFFGHWDPSNGHGPGERANAGGYRFYTVGENLAAGQRTPAEAIQVWMESKSHHDIILNAAWREVGVAVRTGGEYGIYWVLEFGDPVVSVLASSQPSE